MQKLCESLFSTKIFFQKYEVHKLGSEIMQVNTVIFDFFLNQEICEEITLNLQH